MVGFCLFIVSLGMQERGRSDYKSHRSRPRGGTMPINRLLKDKRTPEEIELLNKAFDHALNLLGVVDRNDPLCDLVARKVIEVGTTGISEPREIAEMAVVRIGLR